MDTNVVVTAAAPSSGSLSSSAGVLAGAPGSSSSSGDFASTSPAATADAVDAEAAQASKLASNPAHGATAAIEALSDPTVPPPPPPSFSSTSTAAGGAGGGIRRSGRAGKPSSRAAESAEAVGISTDVSIGNLTKVTSHRRGYLGRKQAGAPTHGPSAAAAADATVVDGGETAASGAASASATEGTPDETAAAAVSVLVQVATGQGSPSAAAADEGKGPAHPSSRHSSSSNHLQAQHDHHQHLDGGGTRPPTAHSTIVRPQHQHPHPLHHQYQSVLSVSGHTSGSSTAGSSAGSMMTSTASIRTMFMSKITAAGKTFLSNSSAAASSADGIAPHLASHSQYAAGMPPHYASRASLWAPPGPSALQHQQVMLEPQWDAGSGGGSGAHQIRYDGNWWPGHAAGSMGVYHADNGQVSVAAASNTAADAASSAWQSMIQSGHPREQQQQQQQQLHFRQSSAGGQQWQTTDATADGGEDGADGDMEDQHQYHDNDNNDSAYDTNNLGFGYEGMGDDVGEYTSVSTGGAGSSGVSSDAASRQAHHAKQHASSRGSASSSSGQSQARQRIGSSASSVVSGTSSSSRSHSLSNVSSRPSPAGLQQNYEQQHEQHDNSGGAAAAGDGAVFHIPAGATVYHPREESEYVTMADPVKAAMAVKGKMNDEEKAAVSRFCIRLLRDADARGRGNAIMMSRFWPWMTAIRSHTIHLNLTLSPLHPFPSRVPSLLLVLPRLQVANTVLLIRTRKLIVSKGDLARALQDYINPMRPREFYEKLVGALQNLT